MATMVDACILVGCGGTGSLLVEPLSRLLAYHASSAVAKREPGLVLCDGDRFESKNAARQLGCEPGAFKANVAAQRARLALPAPCVLESCGYLDRGSMTEILQGLEATCPLVVLAVDNHATRRECMLAWEANVSDGLLVSPGNELTDGSVLAWLRRHERNLTPSPLEVGPDGPSHPELLKPSDRMPGGCIEQAPSAPQLISANLMAASLTLAIVSNYLDGEPVPGETVFDVRKCASKGSGCTDKQRRQ